MVLPLATHVSPHFSYDTNSSACIWASEGPSFAHSTMYFKFKNF